MESDGSSNKQDGQRSRTPPDEQQTTLEKAGLARGPDSTADSGGPDSTADSGGPDSTAVASGPDSAALASSGPASTADSGDPGASALLPPGGGQREPLFPAPSRPIGSGAGSSDGIDLGPRFRPWSEPATVASPGPIRCQFLKAVGPDGKLTDAQNMAVPAHRCAAFGDPLPLSLRQQELVCLQRVHVSCPRYARGMVLASEPAVVPQAREGRGGRLSPLTLVGICLVILAIGTLLSSLLGLPPFGGGKPLAHAQTAAPSASASKAAPSQSPTVAPSATVSAPPTAVPTAKPTPTSTPAASATWPPGATASRMSLLTQCTDQADCYVYTVRGPGAAPAGNGSNVADTLKGIATWFGVNLDSVRQMNSWLAGSDTIHAGDQLKIPPPTR